MAYLSGIYLVEANASALNNAGSIPGERTDNTVAVKSIKTRSGEYPYVSAQAFRYWLRNTVEAMFNDIEFSPITRESKIAYTEANPITYWDDDVLGYMRAKAQGGGALTRISPFRTSTLVSIAPVNITNDFGTMSRHEGNPVPHEHQFYKTTLKGSLSLNLFAVGRFYTMDRTGYKNLDEERIKIASGNNLSEIKNGERIIGYLLNQEERFKRIEALLRGISSLDGGAKQTLHYTDVAPSFEILAIIKGGNNIFQNAVTASTKGLPIINIEALKEILTVYKDEVISPIYLGWPKGYLDEQKNEVIDLLQSLGVDYYLEHPKNIAKEIVTDIKATPSCLNEVHSSLKIAKRVMSSK